MKRLLRTSPLAATLALTSTAVLYLYLAVEYLRLPTLATFDAVGHVAAVTTAATYWPAWHSWQPRELTGWPQDLYYPPLTHWLAAGLSKLIGVTSAVQLVVVASILLLPISLYFYIRQVIESERWHWPAVLTLSLILVGLPNYLGSDMSGLFQLGLIPNFTVLPLVFCVWGLTELVLHRPRVRFAVLLGLVLALAIWTHIVGGIVAVGYVGVALSLSLVRRHHRTSLLLLSSIAGGLIVSSPVWINLARLSSLTIGSPSVIASFARFNIALFVLIVMTYAVISYRRRQLRLPSPILAYTALLVGVCALDGVLAARYPTSALTHLNLYRWQTFAYLLAVVAVIRLLARGMAARNLRLRALPVTLVLVALLGGLVMMKGPARFSYASVHLTSVPNVSGRWIDTMRLADVYPAPYTLQEALLARDPSLFWAYGIFVESDPNAGFIKSLERSLDPAAYAQKTPVYLPEEYTVSKVRLPALLNLFGINAIVSLDNSTTDNIGTWERGGVTKYYHLASSAPSPLAVAVPFALVPVSDTSHWSRAVFDWWQTSGELATLPYDAHKTTITTDPSPQTAVVVTRPNNTTITLNIESDHDVPVLIKESYAPGWTAEDTQGKPLTIWRSAPSLMLVSAHGNVTLRYQ